MNRIGSIRPPSVNASGADAGRILRGTSLNNHGLRLLISQAQRRGKDGAITGSFVILDAGDNKHTQSLTALLDRPTNAEEVLAVIRSHHPGCVHVANTSILAVEPSAIPSREPGPPWKTPGAERPSERREEAVADGDF
jgi:hypothetical protein